MFGIYIYILYVYIIYSILDCRQAVNSKIHVSRLFLTDYTAAQAQGFLSLQES